MARGYSRNPYSSYSGYGSPTRPSGTTTTPSELPEDYPQKEKEHSAAQHLEAIHQYIAKKRSEHADSVWRPSEAINKDIALHKAMASIEKAFPQRK